MVSVGWSWSVAAGAPGSGGAGCRVDGGVAAGCCGVGPDAGCASGVVAAGCESAAVWAGSAGAARARGSRRAKAFSTGRRLIRVWTVTSTILPKCTSLGANCFEKRVEFDREGRGDFDRLVGLGMGEGEMGSVKEVSVELLGFREAGDCVRGSVEG